MLDWASERARSVALLHVDKELGRLASHQNPGDVPAAMLCVKDRGPGPSGQQRDDGHGRTGERREDRRGRAGEITAERSEARRGNYGDLPGLAGEGSDRDADGVRRPVNLAFDPDQPRDEHGRWSDGGGGDYASASPSAEQQANHVAAVHTLNAAGKEAAEKVGRTPLAFHELTADGNERFHAAISAAKIGRFAAAVHVYEPGEYRGTRMFLTPDSKVGFAIKPDGDIVSAFKNPGAMGVGKAANSALALATQHGGKKLDAFDTVLPKIYSESGFRAVARLAWNDTYKPEGWDYNTFGRFNGGRPDVVFMVHDPGNAAPYAAGDGKRVASYEEGQAEQAKALSGIEAARARGWRAIKVASLALLRRDVDYIQDPETGRLEGSRPHGSAKPEADAKPAATPAAGESGGLGKKETKISDFAKDEVSLDSDTRTDPEKQKKFLDTWNKHVAEAPAEFRKEFLGGLNGTMYLSYNDRGDVLKVGGYVKDAGGNKIGEYNRTIDFKNKRADSDYFKLFGGKQHAGVGKSMLAGNVAMYQKMGFDEVRVHANIDVGGYAWARYGYVPTARSWNDLSSELDAKVDRMAGGGGFRASSWEEMGSGQQSQIENAWMRSTEDEFFESEVNNWRENGQPLDDAKIELADGFDHKRDWAEHALDGYASKREKEGKPDFPFTTEQILDAISISYRSNGDGSGSFDVNFDDDKLTEPTGFDPAQPTLPGIPEIEPHELLTEQMRNGITATLERAFDREAENNAADAEPPEYLRDAAQEYQGEYWDSMSDDQKYEWARRNEPDLVESDDGDEPTREIDDDDVERLHTLTQSDDPKALWLIADSKYGKDLLLGTDWQGVIDLHDKQTLDRFDAYTGKAKSKS